VFLAIEGQKGELVEVGHADAIRLIFLGCRQDWRGPFWFGIGDGEWGNTICMMGTGEELAAG